MGTGASVAVSDSSKRRARKPFVPITNRAKARLRLAAQHRQSMEQRKLLLDHEEVSSTCTTASDVSDFAASSVTPSECSAEGNLPAIPEESSECMTPSA
mmetsp:Transcript_42988/g.78879  ORF Transcript_42988/g.78879 Transcript_42988/m.78879 type:complete len:99 (+) Transcript_42988:106-402(+)